jgi:hypothetical protein
MAIYRFFFFQVMVVTKVIKEYTAAAELGSLGT